MTSGATYFKYSIWLLAIIAVFILLKWTGCICNKSAHSGNDTLSHKIDTVYVKTIDTINVPYEKLVPYKVTYIKDRVLHDTLLTVELQDMHIDTAKILEQYFATRFYSSTHDVKYGKVTVNDTVTQNRIVGRSILLEQDIPVVKETVTLREKKRAILYFSIAAMGNKEHLPYASGAGLALKMTNDGILEGMAYLTNDKPMFGASIKIPIRLRKRK